MLRDNIYFISGIHIYNYKSKSNYDYAYTDSSTNYNLKGNFINRLNFFEIPILVEKKIDLKKIEMGIRLGPKINILREAFISLPNTSLTDFKSIDKQEISKVSIGFFGSVPFYFYLTNSLNFQIEPNFQWNFTSLKIEEPTSRLNFWSAGLLFRISSYL